jgi:hypothetical protein
MANTNVVFIFVECNIQLPYGARYSLGRIRGVAKDMIALSEDTKESGKMALL